MGSLQIIFWPIRYKPLPDEIFSSWLVRLAHGHGLKAQTFCNFAFGNRLQIWNRDIDRLAPSWLIQEVSCRTGVLESVTLGTTLRAYEGMLFKTMRWSGPQWWILALQMYHRKRTGFGLQYCPACLTEDAIPYFRKRWRVAFVTVCVQHGIMLLDRCPKCKSALAFHRLDMSMAKSGQFVPLSHCHECWYNLCDSPRVEPISYNSRASALLHEAIQALRGTYARGKKWNVGRYAVMHQLCRIMITKSKHAHLREFVEAQLGCKHVLPKEGTNVFEMLSIDARHHLLQLVAWLMVDPDRRLVAAWRAGAIRYSMLLKDFEERPEWYDEILVRLENWRDRLE